MANIGRRRLPTPADFRQTKMQHKLAIMFLAQLQQRFQCNRTDKKLKIWSKKVYFFRGFSYYTWYELYLTPAAYAGRIVRFAYWLPAKIFGSEMPFIARTESDYGIIKRIIIGDERAADDARFALNSIRLQYPKFFIPLFDRRMNPLDAADDEP